MVAIAPFCAVRFDPERVDLRTATSPPHDVIPDDERDARIAADPHSIVNVILAPPADGDQDPPEGPNRYERSRDTLAEWTDEGILVRDDRPGFYLYEVHHGDPDAPGGRRTMRGFYCRIKLDPTYERIKRHEKTLPKKKKDRLHLRTVTRCDTESIWLLYRDERGWVDEILTSNAFDELLRFTDEDGAQHVLWRVDRPEAVTEIVAQFEDRDVVIADGHHRYQTALDHHAATGRDEDGSLLVCLVRDTDPGLRIEPTHRLVFGLGFDDLHSALERAREHWDMAHLDLPGDAEAAGAEARRIVDKSPGSCIVLAGDQAVHLTLKEGHEVDEGRGRLDSLHVTRVHERLLEPWGVDPDEVESHLHYTRTATEAVEKARAGDYPFVVMLAGEDVDAVLDVASQGHVMPQKATYFVPKLRSGIVLGPLDEPLPRDWQELAGDGGRREFRMPPLD